MEACQSSIRTHNPISNFALELSERDSKGRDSKSIRLTPSMIRLSRETRSSTPVACRRACTASRGMVGRKGAFSDRSTELEAEVG